MGVYDWAIGVDSNGEGTIDEACDGAAATGDIVVSFGFSTCAASFTAEGCAEPVEVDEEVGGSVGVVMAEGRERGGRGKGRREGEAGEIEGFRGLGFA